MLDIDGVISPIPGPSDWGDDVIAGHCFGPVVVSPTMITALEHLAGQPGVTCAWLTSWRPEGRAAMNPFPGQDWPVISSVDDHPSAGTSEDPATWWKWKALHTWLDKHLPTPAGVIWCDDHLLPPDLIDSPEESALRICEAWLTDIDYHALLIAPDVHRGLTPDNLTQITHHATGPPPRVWRYQVRT
ncbi:HAD domain-containing protein [Ornithinimicrobium faecis]|uniref:HAD domain-containing protein n=1 Tax=Ornithinimicrobium faecis TaxID=2934158 RepID=UPI002118EC09|nr:HAD domain-containing protein [Ornithinimicrobium sp. HY1745]